MARREFRDMTLNIPVYVQEVGDVYPDQADYEDYDDIEVVVELFCEDPNVEGSLEIVAARWKVFDILDNLNLKVTKHIKGSGYTESDGSVKPGKYDTYKPIYQENPDETVTEVFEDITKKSGKSSMNPLQELLVNSLDELLRTK